MLGARRTLAAVSLGLLFGTSPARARDGDFAAEERIFRQAVSPDARKSLVVRAAARENLARTRDPRAIPLFADDYRQKAWADGPDRFLIASIAGRLCRGPASLAPAWAAWRERCATPADAWLWYRALLVEEEIAPGAAASVVLDAARAPSLRAAALRVLEERLPKGAFEVVDALGRGLPSDRAGRGLLVEGMASFVATARGHVKEPAYRKALERVLRSLDDPATGDRVREFVGRRLATVFGTDVLATNGSAPWMREFQASGVPAPAAPPLPRPPDPARPSDPTKPDDPADPAKPGPKKPPAPAGPVFPEGFDDPDEPESPKDPKFPKFPKGFEEPEEPSDPDGPERYAGPTVFFGISAVGTRVAYVIDGSGSMSAPLSGGELEDLRARTGADTDGKRKGKAVDPDADALGIDWRRVHTRFDAAREFLKASLRRQLREAQKEHDRARARGAVTGEPAGAPPPPTVAPPSPRSFTIVLFASTARSLRSTPGMMPVTKANVEAAIDDLDAQGPGGMTNVYGALLRAFSTGRRGPGPWTPTPTSTPFTPVATSSSC